ncbi:MAG: hypothetical protein IJH82_12245 [Lachnospiraceae bacterium]|nr:hypothetical protein [Lachnospiraceae bacterium]
MTYDFYPLFLYYIIFPYNPTDKCIGAEVSIPDTILNLVLKVLFFGFILFADKKLHWFDQVKKDDVAIFNAKRNK